LTSVTHPLAFYITKENSETWYVVSINPTKNILTISDTLDFKARIAAIDCNMTFFLESIDCLVDLDIIPDFKKNIYYDMSGKSFRSLDYRTLNIKVFDMELNK
jgi:hypothetical protein